MPRLAGKALRRLPWVRVVMILKALRDAHGRLTPAERKRAAQLAGKLRRERRLARDELRELRRMAAKGAGW
jgi:hypothetical protein